MLSRIRRFRLHGGWAALWLLAWALVAGPCLAAGVPGDPCGHCLPETAAHQAPEDAGAAGHGGSACLHCASDAVAATAQAGDRALPGPEPAALPIAVRQPVVTPAVPAPRIQRPPRPAPGPALHLRCCRFLI